MFTQAEGQPALFVARYDGNMWQSVGATGLPGQVYSVAVHGGQLYAGGAFSSIARWNGTQWLTVGGGLGDALMISTLAVYNGALHAAGFFPDGPRVVRLDGETWTTIAGFTDEIHVMKAHGGELWVGTSGGIRRWDGQQLSAAASGPNGAVHVLSALQVGDESLLYAGGEFPGHLAVWDGQAWTPVCAGTSGPVYALAPHIGPDGSAIYMGGEHNAQGTATGWWPEGTVFGLPVLVGRQDRRLLGTHPDGGAADSRHVDHAGSLSGGRHGAAGHHEAHRDADVLGNGCELFGDERGHTVARGVSGGAAGRLASFLL